MVISLWRTTHLWLAIVSAIFILIASVTGAILSLEPVYENSHGFKVAASDQQLLGEVLEVVKGSHDEVLSISRDPNGFILLQTLEASKPFYIDPFTGEKIGELFETPEIFEFCRTLHRSLFIGKLGRFLIGITSVFMLLISISGFFLILKKQGGWKKYFSKVVKNDFYKDYHTKLSRWLIISLTIISVTGAYLFLERFKVVPGFEAEHTIDESKLTDRPKVPISEFDILRELTLKDLREVTFPFAEFPDEYFEFKLKTKELLVNQFSGEVISEIEYPIRKLISQLSFSLHTGEGTVLWASVLGLSGLGILFFIYSGFAIYFKRGKTKIANPFDKKECSFIILFGSEQGSTLRFANALHKALIRAGEKSYLTDMNSYEQYESLEYLLILTSTYGVGEAPVNANKFVQLVKSFSQGNNFKYAVLGFGSKAYPDFCLFAVETDKELRALADAEEVLPLGTVDNASKESFLQWADLLSQRLDVPIAIENADLDQPKERQFTMEVINKQSSPNRDDHTFTLRLRCTRKEIDKFRSGDLLALLPQEASTERLYSMSVDSDKREVLLSVRRHEHGLCSNYLFNLDQGDVLRGRFKSNPQFHFPEKAPGVIMIANGTGIAPFLGMIKDSPDEQNIALFWGGQNQMSYQLYAEHLETVEKEGKINKCVVAYSRENHTKQYVQDVIAKEVDWVIDSLMNDFAIMICGGLSMQKAVEALLDESLQNKRNLPLAHFKEKGLIKTDCY